ncbi:MAG: hypothetical protein Kow0062_23950 [Acidobacteriota bacterium]
MSDSRPDDPLVLTVRRLLAGILLASLAAWLVLGGRPGVWAVPERVPAPGALVRGLLLAASLAGALLACEALVRRRGGRTLRALGLVAVWLGLAAVMRSVLPPTYIGDWQWILWIVEDGRPLGKWYGASLVYVLLDGGFHLVASPTAFSSVRWTSALCGAAAVMLWWATARALGVTRIGRAWPALLLAAFGVVGVGLGHLEVYAAVVLLLSVFVFTAVRMLQRPSVARVAWFALAAGICFGGYVALLLLLPPALVLVLWSVGGLDGWLRRAIGAGVAATLIALPTLAAHTLGPEPIDGRHLIEFWADEAVAGEDAPEVPSASWRADASWSVMPHLIAPGHWLSGWHLADLAQAGWLDDRLGLVLTLILGPFWLLARRAGRRRGTAKGDRETGVGGNRALVGVALVAFVFLAYAFVILNGRPYPWDWDLFAWAALPTSLLGAGILARIAPPGGFDRTVQRLLAGVGVVAILHGASFVNATPRVARAFGPSVAGLRLGVVPERWEIADGRPVHVWLWLQNDTARPLHVRPGAIAYALSAGNADFVLRQPRRQRPVVGGRWVPAGGRACLHDFLWRPRGLAMRARQAGELDWQTFDGERLAGLSFAGRLEVVLPDQALRGVERLESNPLSLDVRGPAAP